MFQNNNAENFPRNPVCSKNHQKKNIERHYDDETHCRQ
ncbi:MULTISPECIES: hypothetical protein [Bartonella]